jgi:PAS domain S-box-containing protein
MFTRLLLAVADTQNIISTFSIAIFLVLTISFVCCRFNQNAGKRQQLETELEQERNYTSTILNTANALIVVLDVEGKIVSFNRACEHTTNYLCEQVSDKYIWELVLLPEDVELWQSALTAVVTERLPITFEIYWITRSSDRRLISWTLAAICDRQGKVECVICTGIDISQRQQIEQKLQETTRLQNAILNGANYAVIATDIEGTILTFNLAAQKWLGYSSQEVVGKTTPLIFHDPGEVLKRSQELSQELGTTIEPDFEVFVAQVRQGQPDEREWSYIGKDGSRFLVLLSTTALIDTYGNITGFLGIASDITQRKQAELALRESEERFQAFMNNTPAMAFIKDAQSRMIYINKPLEHKFQVKLADLRGKRDDQWLPAEIAKHTLENDLLVLSTGKTMETVENVPTPDGVSHHWLVFKFLLNGVNDKPLIGGVAVDITERKNAEDRVKAALEEKDILLKEVHHRVKNNLQVIDSLFRHQCRYIKNEKVTQIIKECQSRVSSMALLHEKLYQSKDLTNIDFADYVKSLVNNLFDSYRIISSPPILSLDIEDISLDVETCLSCGLIINELVTNSLKYAFLPGKECEISIKFFALNLNTYRLIVSDNGVGLPTSLNIEQINSLGLKLVKSFTRQLDGELKINRNGGTEFIITFIIKKLGQKYECL